MGQTMDVVDQINGYLDSQPEPKQGEMRRLHQVFQDASPGCKLWYTDGRDETGKVVANPNIGYGSYTIKYKDGSAREFYRIGLSANTAGISVYILGLEDKEHLAKTYGQALGKAKVTGYCIRFKSTKDIETGVLEAAVRYGLSLPSD